VVFFAYLWLGLSLLAAAVIDLEYVYIPGALTTSSTVLAFATLPLREQVTPTEAVVGAVFGFLLVFLPFELGYKALRGRTGMARGDAMLVMLSGAWFGWFGAAFALGAAAIQGTLFLIVTLIVKGKVEETEAVDAELQAMREAVAQAEGEERAELERELAEDPLAEERLSGVGGMRLVFGPFIALAIVEYLLFGEFVRAALFGELS
jgi:leader peptidase (prepilin peptidase)/N-methyltransferase